MVCIENVSKEFRKNTVLEQINLEMKNGKIYGLVGRNGSGKTVLIKMIAGLCEPSEGEILIDGEKRKKGSFAKSLGLVCDSIGFMPMYSAYENLYQLAKINHLIGENEINEILDIVGLDYKSNKPYCKFSLGMKQKLAIAQAFMEKPALLLLDEPFNGLDEESVKEMQQFFRKYVDENNAIMLITSHHREDIDDLVNEIFQIKNGRMKG